MKKSRDMNKVIKQLLLLVCSIGLITSTHAFFGLPSPVWGFTNNFEIYKGHAYARGLYTDEDGNLVYVVYDEEGKESEEIGALAEGSEYENSFLMSAAEFNQYVASYEQQVEQFEDFYGADAPNKPELLTAEEYNNRLLELTVVGSETPGDWNGDSNTHRLLDSTRSVLVQPETLLLTASTQYLLAQYPVDLTERSTSLGTHLTSLVIGFDGDILDTSEDRIGFRSIFFENTSKPKSDEERYNLSYFTRTQDWTEEDLELIAPIRGLSITPNVFTGGAVTDENGRYSMMVRGTPCPLFYYSMPIYLDARIPSRPFNPNRPGSYHYYMSKLNYFSCQGYGPQSSILVSSADFPVDVNLLSGRFNFPGIELAGELDEVKLEYDFNDPETTPNTGAANGTEASRFTNTAASYYDFDLDGTTDTSVCGTLNDGVFIPIAQDATDCSASTVQGIYLSGSSSAPYTCTDTDSDGNVNPDDPQCQPQFTRLIDTEKVTQHIGLVKKMATEHVQDTDLFIIRQSNGQLVAMRQGLKDSEGVYTGSPNDIETRTDELIADYRMLMRGPKSYLVRPFTENANNYGQLQQNSNMAPELQQIREADQLRTGEILDVWAINRVTGYLGHQTIVLGANALSSGYLDTLVPTIQMYPPNLKIWAERDYTIEAGLTQGENRHYLIGNEGIGEADDTYIKVTVQWLDQDGSPLPDALSSYGYTGRLAYANGTNNLTDASQAGNARFGIEPGTNTELIRLSGQNANQHYYVQVNAVPEAEFDDFALADEGKQNRSNDATFKEVEHNHYRPERFVPFLTPQHNEELSEIQQQAYLIEKQRRISKEEPLDDLTKPSALYDWYYRPDYQFSVYDLAVNEINLIGNDPDTGEETEINIIDSSDPKITGASIVDILYDLTSSSQSPLERLDGEQTLVLSLGQQETNVTLTENNTIRFESLDYLNQLGSDDYLTIALYSNEDSANLLYEYMFEKPTIFIEKEDPEFTGLPLRWDDYYPTLGNKILTIRSDDISDAMVGQTVRATILNTNSSNARLKTLGSSSTEGAISVETTLERDGEYLRAKFELVGNGIEPSTPLNEDTDNTQIRFDLIASNNRIENTTQGIWYTRTNANIELEEVLSGFAVYLFDTSAGNMISNANHKSLSDDEAQRFDYVQTLFNQVIPRKRSVFANNGEFNYMDEDGIFLNDSVAKVAQFKTHFFVDNTIEDAVNSFNKLMKDYPQTLRSEWQNRMVDKILLLGEDNRQTDNLPNSAEGGDTGLYELYVNAVEPFVDAMIAEAELFAGDAGDSGNTVPTDQWIARTGENAEEHGAGMSYCFGCKQTIEEFNNTVANCQAENAAAIVARETDQNQTNYRGHVTVNAQGECEVVATGGRRWAGLYGTRAEFYRTPNIEVFEARYWSGIDCSGLVKMSVNAARNSSQGLNITIPRAVTSTGSQQYVGNNSYVYSTYGSESEQKLKKGDVVQYEGHISIVYENPDREDEYAYRVIHAFGNHQYVENQGDDPIFARKVMVTRHSIKTPTGFGRIKLWD